MATGTWTANWLGFPGRFGRLMSTDAQKNEQMMKMIFEKAIEQLEQLEQNAEKHPILAEQPIGRPEIEMVHTDTHKQAEPQSIIEISELHELAQRREAGEHEDDKLADTAYRARNNPRKDEIPPLIGISDDEVNRVYHPLLTLTIPYGQLIVDTLNVSVNGVVVAWKKMFKKELPKTLIEKVNVPNLVKWIYEDDGKRGLRVTKLFPY